ncbi:MAG: hypothetical protein V2A54_08820 [Bacteroidota bacterium]
MPLTRPPGRSREFMNGTSTEHSPGAQACTVNSYGLRNGVAAKMPFSSSIDTAGVFIDRPPLLPSFGSVIWGSFGAWPRQPTKITEKEA